MLLQLSFYQECVDASPHRSHLPCTATEYTRVVRTQSTGAYTPQPRRKTAYTDSLCFSFKEIPLRIVKHLGCAIGVQNDQRLQSALS